MEDQVVAYVQEKIKKPTIVVGNSLGGYAALAAGAELNELNAGVILLNAAGYFSEEKTIKKNMLQTSIETVAGIFLKNIVLQRLIFENMRNPRNIKKTIKIQATLFIYFITSLLMMNQLNLFARAIGSKTVIFFLSIVRRPESFKSPNNLVIVTLVEPIASAIA